MALSLQRYAPYDSLGINRILKERIKKERETSAVIAIEIGDVLPDNVILEILSWLPVKALLQFKTVCKSWYAIISSPTFISKHLENYYKNNDNDGLLVQYYISHAELQLFELMVDETPRIAANRVLYDMPMYGSYVCGPCDGIYYLFNSYDDVHALWNPAIDELKVLPPMITKPDLPSNLKYAPYSEGYGFGYDPTTDDYKVVVIKGYSTILYDEDSQVSYPFSVLVYSLRADSWKYCGDFPQSYCLVYNKCYIVVDGLFYWLASPVPLGNPEVIISFDMSADSIQEVNIPSYDQPASTSLAVYDDSLAFLAVHDNEKRFDIWTWNEGLWAKKFTMGPIANVRRPVGHWKKNKLILEGPDGLVLCDPDAQEIKNLGFQMSTSCKGVYVYRESLLSVKDRKGWRHIDEEAGHIFIMFSQCAIHSEHT